MSSSKPVGPGPNLIGKPRPGLEAFMAELGEPAFRAQQIMRWLYHSGCRDFAAMRNLPQSLRERLNQRARLEVPVPEKVAASPDGTEKLLFRFADGAPAEAVIIPDEERTTLCISSQAGCPLACTFCQTGRMGAGRNLERGEIVGQVLAAQARCPERRLTNLVFMGMGEPLLNLDELRPALALLTDELGTAFAPWRITISTAGIVPGIEALAELELAIGLAISLNAPTDELRDQLMPINRKYKIRDLLDAVHQYLLRTGGRRRVTFEYVLLPGVNDHPEHADQLGRLVAPTNCRVNLIPHNPIPGDPYKAPEKEDLLRFQERVARRVRVVTIRWSRGGEVAAACGQLGSLADSRRTRQSGP